MFGKSGSVLRFYKKISIVCLISASGVTGASAQASLEVDMENISRVAGEFHVRFFDEDSRLLDLNEAEIRTYFEREKGAPPGPVTYEIGEDDRPAGEGAKEGDDPAPKGALALGYTKRCRDAGVPIFPPLPLAAPPWKRLKDLPKDKIFNAPDYNPVQVWQFKTEKGTCIALPRFNKDDGTQIQEIGFICQSKATGKACFWAAQDKKTGKRLTTPAELRGKKPEDLRGGDDLALNCTGCHRGENVFIAFPGTSLEGASEFPDKRYGPVPVRQKGWENDGKVALTDTGCGQCHESFATPTLSWCATVLKPSLGRTMPYDIVTDKVIPKADLPGVYKGDLKRLDALCRKAGLKNGLGVTLD
ncbi:hypothetical protein ROG8370_02289 [Roseovarius gaetbuli]|uniref:Uncharacterized protein n=1 Tax=Roseovarius gaetbuli TaxID=1356575 RepID=A0A1X6ZHC3_9RHOB|nr:hypothetical protein [Roseovarius gaetbuli]SLN51679.1 hypothetical protein ROG8370_02289 [Roseovarius gaetbuli]